MRNSCSTRYSSVFSRTISANGLPVRHAVHRHCKARHEMLCSTLRLNESIIVARACWIALRMAGPMTGNSASASGCGFLRTDAVIASSIIGAIAPLNLGSFALRANASGSTVATD